ncbi:type VI secretion system tip protein TssI/VgrG [Vibrio sp. YMD68]|uniref:type VI secretion system Vgr family protein n=1 Tax=Vibrio sp. YMD68 TaxID=3042300 RepID=UPI00249C9E11|nr:type VI secretion system tip protein TssI/VgrG [Vibrio sp. YMD68]WGW00174.1 type VI secretion system tip protein TssI/VgrG [Vibrio sp. YMD68]WGW01276.1 type VI secretion system tip protein TssI/VgrG [Vibrio sp. YMD68]
MATLAYTITVEGLSDDAFKVTQFSGQESLSASQFNDRPCYGFCYDINLASRLSTLTADDVVDRRVELKMYRNQQLVQRVHGIARAFTQKETGHHHTFYALTLVPALERLSLRHNSRIFQHQTAPDIIATLLQEMGIDDYTFSLTQASLEREFCVQYRESDLDFLHRLAAEEGIVYSFAHEAGMHTLIFSDSSALLTQIEPPIPYNALGGSVSDTPYIQSFHYQSESHISQVELKDTSFKKPAYSFSQTAQAADIEYQQPDYVHFDAPGRYKKDDNGAKFTQARLESLRRKAQVATGKSNEPLLRAGYRFNMDGHLDNVFNRDWVLVTINRQGEQPQALEEEAGHGATTYNNQWEAIPAHLNWQAAPQVRPTVDGPMIATVVGPEGEEIFCDEYGRVKIRFHWDRDEIDDEQRSCWVRVSQSWAGGQYGAMALPRIGHEVIVSFLNGDPDQPIITGRTYHATNTPPYALPENKTKTVLRSQTHQGEGFNELSFEDQAEKEQIYLHAQKDFDAQVLNDMTQHIKHDQHTTVDNDHFSQIKNNHHLTVEGERRSLTQKDATEIIKGSLHQKVGDIYVIESANEIHLKAGTKVVIEAGAELTLKAGGSFVKVDASGVSLVGAGINLNSGGSAGSGSGFAGKMAERPKSIKTTETSKAPSPEKAIAQSEPVTLPARTPTTPPNALLKPCEQKAT